MCVRVCVRVGHVRVHDATYVLQACSVAPQRVLLQRAAQTYVSVRLCQIAQTLMSNKRVNKRVHNRATAPCIHAVLDIINIAYAKHIHVDMFSN